MTSTPLSYKWQPVSETLSSMTLRSFLSLPELYGETIPLEFDQPIEQIFQFFKPGGRVLTLPFEHGEQTTAFIESLAAWIAVGPSLTTRHAESWQTVHVIGAHWIDSNQSEQHFAELLRVLNVPFAPQRSGNNERVLVCGHTKIIFSPLHYVHGLSHFAKRPELILMDAFDRRSALKGCSAPIRKKVDVWIERAMTHNERQHRVLIFGDDPRN